MNKLEIAEYQGILSDRVFTSTITGEVVLAHTGKKFSHTFTTSFMNTEMSKIEQNPLVRYLVNRTILNSSMHLCTS